MLGETDVIVPPQEPDEGPKKSTSARLGDLVGRIEAVAEESRWSSGKVMTFFLRAGLERYAAERAARKKMDGPALTPILAHEGVTGDPVNLFFGEQLLRRVDAVVQAEKGGRRLTRQDVLVHVFSWALEFYRWERGAKR